MWGGCLSRAPWLLLNLWRWGARGEGGWRRWSAGMGAGLQAQGLPPHTSFALPLLDGCGNLLSCSLRLLFRWGGPPCPYSQASSGLRCAQPSGAGAGAEGQPSPPRPPRGQLLTSTIGLDLSPRWSRPAFSGRGRGKGRPWAPAFQSSSADRGPPSPQPGGRGPSPSTDPSPVWSDPLGSRARWPQGTARAAWDTRGAWDPASLWREQKEAKQGSSLLGCHAPALLASSLSGSSSRETGNSPAGLEKATSVSGRPPPPPCPGFPWRLGPGRNEGGNASRAPRGPLGPREPTGRTGSCKEGKDGSRGPEVPD